MEQLKDPVYRLEAVAVTGDGERSPFSLSIFRGKAEELGYLHIVRCPYIRNRDLKIHGGDDDESLANALLFVESYLDNMNARLVDHSGQEICLPPYEYTAKK